MKTSLYLWTVPVTLSPFKQIGWAMTRGKGARHCCVCWESEKGSWRVEMAGTGDEKVEIIGKGIGYRIVISKMKRPVGELIGECPWEAIETTVRSYGSTRNGPIPSIWLCKWSNDPQGFGGPLIHTCNTYARWVLETALNRKIEQPRGAIGWNLIPQFPCPRSAPTEE